MDENEHDRLCNNNNNTFYLKIVLKSRTLRPSDIFNNNHGLIIHFAKHIKFTHKHSSTHLDLNSSKGTMVLLLLYMFRLKQNVIQQNV